MRQASGKVSNSACARQRSVSVPGIGGQGAPVSGCVAWYRYPPALSETQPSGPQFDIRTENGFPVPGIRGWNSGAAASTS